MTDYNMVFTTNQPTTSIMENPGPETQGPVLAQVGTTALPSGWTDSVLVNDSLITTELSNTVSLRQSEQDPFNSLTRVMSPNNPSNLQLEANQTVLLGLQCRCQVCNVIVEHIRSIPLAYSLAPQHISSRKSVLAMHGPFIGLYKV